MRATAVVLVSALLGGCQAMQVASTNRASQAQIMNRASVERTMDRRSMLASVASATFLSVALPEKAEAAPDCFKDCVKSCKLIAPKDVQYCNDQCTEYCSQPDREDGLSGSKGAANGEVGLLGGSFGQGTVPKGEDRPPILNLPGLDFSSDKGKKLLGY